VKRGRGQVLDRHGYVGTAGWSVPRQHVERESEGGTHLERYGRVCRATEINSSFYRRHAVAIYRKWAAATPNDFRFAVKVPRAITHDQRLADVEALLEGFLSDIAGLGDKQGPLLVQRPPIARRRARQRAPVFRNSAGAFRGTACLRATASDLVQRRDRCHAGELSHRPRRRRSGPCARC
jgi:uncharacterized protein YecE (DUF72 family)